MFVTLFTILYKHLSKQKYVRMLFSAVGKGNFSQSVFHTLNSWWCVNIMKHTVEN